MRKLLLTAAIASLTIVSCVEDEPQNAQKQPQQIKFNTPVLYTADGSRANHQGEIASNIYPEDEDFVVYAIAHEGEFAGWANGTAAAFNNTVALASNKWTPINPNTNKPYYWENEYMSFAAYSPANLEQINWNGANKCTYGAEGLTIEGFEVLADPTKQFDLLFSKRTHFHKQNILTSDENYDGVTIKFQHALSSIHFVVEGDKDAEDQVQLVSIKVKDVNYKGTFTENIEEDGDKYVIGENVNPTWAVDNSKTASYTAVEVATADAINFYDNDGLQAVASDLLLMPQELSDNAILEIKYLVNGEENTKNIKLNTLVSESTTVDEWVLGTRYYYVLRYHAKDKIFFVPTVEEWVDVETIYVNL